MIFLGRPASSPVDVIKGCAWNAESDTDPVAEKYVLIKESTSVDDLKEMVDSICVITESGGLLCHAAIVCRELNIPCIVGVEGILQHVKTGDNLVINLKEGSVEVINK